MGGMGGRSLSLRSKQDILQDLLQHDKESVIWILHQLRERRSDISESIGSIVNKKPRIGDIDDLSSRRAGGSDSKHVMPTTGDDDDSKLPSVQFARLEFHVLAEEEYADLLVTRTGNKDIKSEVHYETRDKSAKAGKEYEAAEGTIVFEPGEDAAIVQVGLHDTDTWEALVDFYVQIDSESAVGCRIGRQLGSARVKIIGTECFPTDSVDAILQEDPGLDDPMNQLKVYLQFLYNLWSNSKIRHGTIMRGLVGQLHNLSFIIFQYINVFMINIIFKEGGYKKIWNLSRYDCIIVIVCVMLFMNLVLHIMDYQKLSWSVGGAARKLIQKGLVRRFMYFDMSSRENVRNSDFSMAVVRDTINLVGGYSKVLDLSDVFGAIIAILIFKLTAPFIFNGHFSLLGLVPFIVYPIFLGIFIQCRANITTDALEKVEMAQNGMLEFVYQAVDCYEVISDHRRRQKYVDDLVQFIDAYNSENRDKNKLVCNNTHFPHWVAVLLVGFWYLYFGKLVIEGPLSLGFFLADLKIIDKFGQEFEKLYKVIMEMQATFPDLSRVVINLNTPTDLRHRLDHERSNLQMTQVLRKAYAVQGKGALDRVPIVIQDLSFTIAKEDSKQFAFKGKFEIPQGKMACFVGKHGHGKTLLLQVIAGSVFPELEAGVLFIPSHLRVLHVSSEPIFLRKSLLDNLTFGCELEEDMAITRVSRILSLLKLDRFIPMLQTEEDDNSSAIWQQSLTLHEASMLNLARAFIANPYVLCVHKPTIACSDKFAVLVMEVLKEFVQQRGVGNDDSRYAQRRPRTVLYTSLRKMSCEYADLIFVVQSGALRQIGIGQLQDDLFC